MKVSSSTTVHVYRTVVFVVAVRRLSGGRARQESKMGAMDSNVVRTRC